MTSPTPDLTRPTVDLIEVLPGGPKVDDTAAGAFAEVEAERKADFGRATDPFTA
jgi:hypothetical protein